MPKRATPLTVKGVDKLKLKPLARSDRLIADGGGLYFRITTTGGRSWVYRYVLAGRRHDLGLGPYPDVSLSAARDKATVLRQQKLAGLDPLAARAAGRVAAARAMTFKACADAYIAAHKAGWRSPKHAAQWRQTLDSYAHPLLGALPVAAIDVGLCMQVLEPVWTAKPETAKRLRGRIEAVLDWAAARGHRQGDNPARWRGHLDNLLPATSKVRRVEHHPALPYGDVAAFMAELRQLDSLAARALEFAILTASRSGEVLGMVWSEIDSPGRLWVIPGERIKGGREHRRPLSDAAVAILARLPRGGPGDRVFPIGTDGLLHTLRRMGRTDLTAHGFCSTFRDWAAECTSYPAEVAEMALAHVVSNQVEAAYRRGDLFEKRRQLAESWGSYCDGGSIVPLRSAQISHAV